MLDLTFGEQVKIILSRKGMTIKELAEIIEERTGKKMSRQNLTQRLGRDNFQEQDMRMIAEILECPFRLSILADNEKTDTVSDPDIESVEPTEKELSKIAKAKAKKEAKAVKNEKTVPAPTGDHETQVSEIERDITIGELVDIHEELDELMKQDGDKFPYPDVADEHTETEASSEARPQIPQDENIEESKEEQIIEEASEEEEVPAEPEIQSNDPEYLEPEAEKDEVSDIESEDHKEVQNIREESEKKARGWRSYLQRVIHKEQPAPEPKTADDVAGTIIENVTSDYIDFESYEDSEDEEEIVEETIEEENRVIGDVNPFTGHEYETNSVRTHPKRIGYVQVYDRSDHRWTDMTEWAFLGYQERKKALLGKDYEPPIYLD